MSRRGRFDYNHHAYKYSVDRRAFIREKAQARCQGGEGLITITMPTNTLLIVGHSFVKRLKQGAIWMTGVLNEAMRRNSRGVENKHNNTYL